MREWFSHPEHMLIALCFALLLVGIARFPRLLAWAYRQRWLMAGGSAVLTFVSPRVAPLAPRPVALTPAVVPGTLTALASPPGVERSIAHMRQRSPGDRYLLPLGWWRSGSERADLVYTALVGETNHVLISGASDCGKDTLVWWMLLSLGLVHREPHELRIAILDGKGLDFQPWANRAHTWLLASESEQIPDALRALTTERKRRRQILERAGVSKWDHYLGGDLPLLVVYISELSLLETALRRERSRRDRDRGLDIELEGWLNDELTSGRAFGIRYLIAMQTVSGMDMLWRSQIGVFMAGYQPDETQVKPNTGKTAKQIGGFGAVAPNLLPPPPTGAGIFTIVSGDDCTTVRAPYLSETERRSWLAYLPETAAPAEELLSTLIAKAPAHIARTSRVSEAATAEKSAAHLPQKIAGSQTTFAAAASDFAVCNLGFSPADIAEIGARIARGEKKTDIVRAMRGYDTRRHREFAGYYDMLHSELGERGMHQA